MLSDKFRAKNENSRKVFLVTFLPPTIWLILFLLAPVLIIVVYSFSQKVGLINIEVNWVMDNYRRAADPLYLKIFIKSIYKSIFVLFDDFKAFFYKYFVVHD